MDNDDIEEVLNDDNEVTPEKAEQAGTKKVVPAYMKKEENKTEESKGKNKKVKSKKEKNKTSKSNKKLIIFCVTAVVILVALAIFIYVLLLNKKYEKYKPYEEPMHTYAFDIMYDNGTATTKEKVTKSEAIKMAIAATLNIEDLPGYIDTNTFTNEIWVKYAVANQILSDAEINELNYNDNVTYIEFVRYLEVSKQKLLGQNLKTSTQLEFKDTDKYTIEEQTYLQDLIETGVIENTNKKLKGNRKLFKGEINELIVKFAEKNNTITLDGDKININPDKVPSNASEYTYILSNVDKEVYEKPLQEGEYTDYVLNPKECYIENKTSYSDIKTMIENYYNAVLNVDYNTIQLEEFTELVNNYLYVDAEEEEISQYIQYVKENNIKITGEAKVQMPIIYYDGTNLRVRTKIEFNIESSKTTKNVLFYDLTYDNDTEYKNGNNSYIIDVVLSTYLNSNGVKIRLMNIDNIKL